MRLLITGGAGFIGSNAVYSLLSKLEVERLVVVDCLTYAGHLSNLKKASKNKKYIFKKIDIRDEQKLSNLIIHESIDHVIHMAAESHVDRSITNPGKFLQTNVIGTFNLINACLKSWKHKENCKFLHVSTDEVYGSLGKKGLFSENDKYKPSSPYSASKAASDHLVYSYIKTFDFPGVISNCSNNFGAFQNTEKLIPKVIKCCLNQLNIPVYGNGKNIRDWLFVKDHVEALWLILNKGKVGENYNIGSGQELENIELIQKICNRVDVRMGTHNNSVKNIKYINDRAGLDYRYALNTKKINELGWYANYEFEMALDWTIEWYYRRFIKRNQELIL